MLSDRNYAHDDHQHHRQATTELRGQRFVWSYLISIRSPLPVHGGRTERFIPSASQVKRLPYEILGPFPYGPTSNWLRVDWKTKCVTVPDKRIKCRVDIIGISTDSRDYDHRLCHPGSPQTIGITLFRGSIRSVAVGGMVSGFLSGMPPRLTKI